MSDETVLATDGTQLPLADIVNNFGYTGSNVTTIVVNYPNKFSGILTQYTQTFTYSGGNVTSISQFTPTGFVASDDKVLMFTDTSGINETTTIRDNNIEYMLKENKGKKQFNPVAKYNENGTRILL